VESITAVRPYPISSSFHFERVLIWNSHQAEDFVLASNETHSVREFIEKSFAVVGTIISWRGSNEDEVGMDQNGKVLVRLVSGLTGSRLTIC
jgi:GDP-D-mannose dehydratase